MHFCVYDMREFSIFLWWAGMRLGIFDVNLTTVLRCLLGHNHLRKKFSSSQVMDATLHFIHLEDSKALVYN